MSAGKSVSVCLPGGLSQLPDLLNNMTYAQALTLGVTAYESVQVVTKQALPRYPGAISRTKEYFNWAQDGALVVIDHDPSECGTKVRDAAHLIKILSEADPQFCNVEYVAADSTSSHLYVDGQCVKGEGGMHLYFCVQGNTDRIKLYFDNLAKKLWLSDYGYIFLSKSASLFERTVIDTNVYEPSRLLFEGGVKIESERITQNRSGANYVLQDGASLDVASLTLTPQEDADYRKIVNQAKANLEPQRERQRHVYRSERTKELKTVGHSDTTIKKMLDAYEVSELLPQAPLLFDEWCDEKGQIISPARTTVGWVLANATLCDGMTLADPLEPAYGGGTNKAIIRLSNGRLTIYSHAHGGRLFYLRHDYESLKSILDSLPYDQCTAQWSQLTANAKLSRSETDHLAEFLKGKIRITKKSFNIDLNEARELSTAQQPQTQHAVAELFINEYLRQQYREGIISVQGNVYVLIGGIWTKVDHSAFSVIIGEEFNIDNICKRVCDYSAISKHIIQIIDQGPDFFYERNVPVGVATPAGFYRIDDTGQIHIETLDPFRHRAMFIMPAAPMHVQTPSLTHWLNTSITGEDAGAQRYLLQEVFGAVLFGLMPTFRKVLLLYGATSTGKSMLLRLLQGLFPKALQSTIKPSDWSNEQHRIRLAGSRLNIAGDLPTSRIIEGDMFKAITGGDEFSGKAVYQEVREHIRSNAAHAFSSNTLPAVQADSVFFDRWIVVEFERAIPESDRIPDLERMIMQNEIGGVLHWAIDGAQRVVKNRGFTLTQSHRKVIDNWQVKANSVREFLSDTDAVAKTDNPENFIRRSDLYSRYSVWCRVNGRKQQSKGRAIEVFDSLLTRGVMDGNPGYRKVRVSY